jgi:hypothetical protein
MSGEERQYPAKRVARPRRDDMPLPATQTRRSAYMPDFAIDDLAEDDPRASRPPRPGSSAIRLNDPRLTGVQRALSPQPTTRQVPVPYRRSGQQPITTTASPVAPLTGRGVRTTTVPRKASYKDETPGEKRRFHWLLLIGVGMLAMLALWVVASSLLSWGSRTLDDIRYGYPRTYQTDAVVGHGGDSAQHPSHFIAINFHRHIIVIELMAGDPAKAVTYGGPYLYGAAPNLDLITPILEFKDVNGDGKPDMIIHLGDQSVVFINTGSKFRPSTPNDTIHL